MLPILLLTEFDKVNPYQSIEIFSLLVFGKQIGVCRTAYVDLRILELK